MKMEAFEFLSREMEKKQPRDTLSFKEYWEKVKADPEKNLRNIFQLLRDMVRSYVKEGKTEDPEEVPFVEYDCSKLFEQGVENPFFADRLFANRLVRQIELMTLGAQQNRIFVFRGSHGCGKSTFLNNLLQKFQEYTDSQDGRSWEIFWEIDPTLFSKQISQKIEIPCPSHDHPISIIPKDYRKEFLDKLLPDSQVKTKIFSQKEYQWIFKQEPCSICNSLFLALREKLSANRVMEMIKVKSRRFDRRLGEGIVVFNPGDRSPLGKKESYLTNPKIQDKLDQIFGPNRIKYIYSLLAKTNNGIYCLMDIKDRNVERLFELHNVISEGVHRAGEVEEKINTLFLALMNPEDIEYLETQKSEQSFQGRIQYIYIPYVLIPEVEVKIYYTIFGKHINSRFLPHVLESFARIIISSRMNPCPVLSEWIDLKKYKKYCDLSGFLLRMEIYAGKMPAWLSEEEKKNLTLAIKRKIIAHAEREGNKGLNGRDSISLFGDFFARWQKSRKLITIDNVADFFENKIDSEMKKKIPSGFVDSLVNWYDWLVLNEVKESLYFYNEQKISEDILHFLTAINYAPREKIRCFWTNKEIIVTIEFLKEMASRLTGKDHSQLQALEFAQNIQKKYTQIVALGQAKEIKNSELYKKLFENYTKNLKQKVLQPLRQNPNFREAIKAYGTKEFEVFDARLREQVAFMISNLINKFGYTQSGAKEIAVYILDKGLDQKFS